MSQQSLVGPHSPDWAGGPWPSQNNRHGQRQAPETEISHIDRSQFEEKNPETVPLASCGQSLRPEAVLQRPQEGLALPVSDVSEIQEGADIIAKPTYAVVDEWHDWMDGYESAHITFENGEGETVRTALENSHQREYANRYYAKLKDLERGINRRFESLTTAMLTFTASTESAEGFARPPADHMLEIREGWRQARKQLHKALSGRNWEYARIWEPHQSGYGHLHVAIFVEGDAVPADFEKVMGSYVQNTKSAGRKAHSLENAVSVNDDVDNLGSYISEYLGIFGEKTATDRSLNERIFRATVWATRTRRLDFSNGAQAIISGEQFRRETGLRPEDRGRAEVAQSDSEAAQSDESTEWEPRCLLWVNGPYDREQANPTAGGTESIEIENRPVLEPAPTD